MELEHGIRMRAYEIWMENGRPDFGADDHWFAAEREFRMRNMIQAAGAAAPAVKAKGAKRAAPSKAGPVAKPASRSRRSAETHGAASASAP